MEEVLKGLNRSHGLGPVAISPDGALLAYVLRGKDGTQLVVAPFGDAAKTTRITAAKKSDAQCSDAGPAWAPDSRRLAFLSDCQSGGQEDVFVAAIGGDLPAARRRWIVQRLTRGQWRSWVSGVFSPDGSQIAFLYVEGATRAAGALAAMKPWAGVIGEDGVEIQRVGVVDAAAQKPVAPEFATPAKLHVYEFDWSPDSKSLAYVAADPPGENNWWVAKLYTQQLARIAQPQSSLCSCRDCGSAAWVADRGAALVAGWEVDRFIGGLMSDQGSTGGDVWLIPSEGGEARDLTPEAKASAAWITWAGSDELVCQRAGRGQQPA